MQKHQVYTGLPDDVLSNWQHHAGAKHQVDPGLPDNVQSPQGLWHPLHGDRYKWQFFLSSLALSTFLSIYICIYPGRKLASLYVSFLIYLSTWVIISTELSSIFYLSIYLSISPNLFLYLSIYVFSVYLSLSQATSCLQVWTTVRRVLSWCLPARWASTWWHTTCRRVSLSSSPGLGEFLREDLLPVLRL